MRPLALAALLLATPAAAEMPVVTRDLVHVGYVGTNPFADDLFVTIGPGGLVFPLRWDGGADPAAFAGCAFGRRDGAMVVGDACPAQIVVDVLSDGNEGNYRVRRILSVGSPGEILWVPRP